MFKRLSLRKGRYSIITAFSKASCEYCKSNLLRMEDRLTLIARVCPAKGDYS